jgi:transketolase
MVTSIQLAKAARLSCLEMVYRARASHIASALSIVDIVSVLYAHVLDHDPADPSKPDRDRFILSKGHACVAVYAILGEIGFFPKSRLLDYGLDGSVLMNHISHHVEGVEFSTGALGHGLPFGVGKALASKQKNESWTTFVLLSDGELQEGSNWEAFMFASHHGLSNIITIIDYNNLQSLTSVDDTLSLEPLEEKLTSFGWQVFRVDGHDHEKLKLSLMEAKSSDRPAAIIADTIKGRGVSFMENIVDWHYRSPNDDQFSAAISEIKNA